MIYLYLNSDPICFLFKSLCLLSTFQSRKGTSTAPHLPNPTHHLTHLPLQAHYSLLFLVLPPHCPHQTSFYNHSWWVTIAQQEIYHTQVLSS